MKRKILLVMSLAAVLCRALLGLTSAASQETTETRKTKIANGTTNALEIAKTYMCQGARWISISHPFMSTDTNSWQVEATFYK